MDNFTNSPEESFTQRRARLLATGGGVASTRSAFGVASRAAPAPAAPAADRSASASEPKTVEDLVGRAGQLAALPQVVMQVIQMTGGSQAGPAELERVIGTDQALTARVLTLANSPYYGLPRRVSSLREAIIFLGFKAVRNLAMTVTSFDLFLGKSDAASLARRDLWRHSLNTGLCAKLIASAVPNAGISEEIHTAALLHDVGKILLIQHFGRAFNQAMEAAGARGVAFHDVEGEFLPFTHGEVGAALAAQWNLPAVLLDAIGNHHYPGRATDDPQTCAAVTLASDLANIVTAPSALPGPEAGDSGDADLASLNSEAVGLLHLKPDALGRLRAACAAEVNAGSSGLGSLS